MPLVGPVVGADMLMLVPELKVKVAPLVKMKVAPVAVAPVEPFRMKLPPLNT